MKTILITILLSFLLTFPFTSTQSKEGMTYCIQAEEAAKSNGRRSLKTNKDGSYILLLDKGECKGDTCVIEETYRDCGYIKQLIDLNGDGECDYALEWKSIVDPTYGVFFIVYSITKCPLII